MAYSFTFPDVGEGITEGEIVRWHVKQGETIIQDQVLCEIETDKAIVKIPSPKAGIIAKIYKKEGEVINVGEALVDIAEQDEKPGNKSDPVQSGPVRPNSNLPTPKKLPSKRTSSTVIGDLEEAPEEDDKPNDKNPKNERPEVFQQIREQIPGTPQPPQPFKSSLAMPSVRKLARDLGIDIENIKGTGSGGRILERDLYSTNQTVKVSIDPRVKVLINPEVSIDPEKSPTNQDSPSWPANPKQSSMSSIPIEKKYDLYGFVERVQLKGLRKAISQHMDESHLKTASVTHMDEADVTHLHEVREREKRIYEPKGIKLTLLPFIVKAVIGALRNHPFLNSTLDDKTGDIILKKYYNIGIACDTPEGLIVPVIKNAHQKSIIALAKEITSLARQARERSINAMDLKGGTFTISNLGSIGGTFFTPIINHPETAILGIGRLCEKIAIKDQKIDIRNLLPLSLTYDHRVVDGAEAARFLNQVKEHLENPEGIFLEMEF